MKRKIVTQEILPFYQESVKGKVSDIIASLTKLVDTYGDDVFIAERKSMKDDGTWFAVMINRKETDSELATRVKMAKEREAKALAKYTRLQKKLKRAGAI